MCVLNLNPHPTFGCCSNVSRHFETLKVESEKAKWKNMSPRERMRIHKQERADKEAARIKSGSSLSPSCSHLHFSPVPSPSASSHHHPLFCFPSVSFLIHISPFPSLFLFLILRFCLFFTFHLPRPIYFPFSSFSSVSSILPSFPRFVFL